MIRKFLKIIERKLKRNNQDIKKNELDKFMKEGALLIDVRSPQEFREGHLNGAISLPEYEIKNSLEKLPKNKSKTIIVYCSTGQRSKKAQKKLQEKGFTNVYNLLEGMENY